MCMQLVICGSVGGSLQAVHTAHHYYRYLRGNSCRWVQLTGLVGNFTPLAIVTHALQVLSESECDRAVGIWFVGRLWPIHGCISKCEPESLNHLQVAHVTLIVRQLPKSLQVSLLQQLFECVLDQKAMAGQLSQPKEPRMIISAQVEREDGATYRTKIDWYFFSGEPFCTKALIFWTKRSLTTL